MDAGKAGSGSPEPEDRAPQADIARSSPSRHVCTHLLPQQRVSYVHALPRSKIRCAGFRPPWPTCPGLCRELVGTQLLWRCAWWCCAMPGQYMQLLAQQWVSCVPAVLRG